MQLLFVEGGNICHGTQDNSNAQDSKGPTNIVKHSFAMEQGKGMRNLIDEACMECDGLLGKKELV